MMNNILWNVTQCMLTESYRTDMILICIIKLDDSGNGDDSYDDRYAGTCRISAPFVVLQIFTFRRENFFCGHQRRDLKADRHISV